MYICLECRTLFEQPFEWEETHGLSTPPYQHLSGCPECYGGYVEAFECDCCGDWITDKYVKVDDKRYCEYCCTNYEVGDEDYI